MAAHVEHVDGTRHGDVHEDLDGDGDTALQWDIGVDLLVGEQHGEGVAGVRDPRRPKDLPSAHEDASGAARLDCEAMSAVHGREEFARGAHAAAMLCHPGNAVMPDQSAVGAEL